MKGITRILLGFIMLSVACTKTKTVYQNVYVNVPVTVTTSPLVNKAWVLTAITINDVSQTLTALQSSYYMTLYGTGLYTDSYGVAGYWSRPVNDSLLLYKNILSSLSLESYAIELSDSLNLVIRTTVGNQKTVYKYIALGIVSTPNPGTPINTTWQLNTINTNGVNENLTATQKLYKMTLNTNGTFWDTDGVVGTWNLPVPDSVRISYSNLPTPISILYKINILTSANLNITKYINGILTTFDFLAAPVSASVTIDKWKFSGLSIDDVAQTITPTQAAYHMSLASNGVFTDTDGAAGLWSNPTSDSLIIQKTNLVTPVTLRYKILTKNSANLIVQKNTGGQKTIETYEAR